MAGEYVVFGAGGHAKVVIATVEAAGGSVVGVYDDDPAKRDHTILGHRITAAPAEIPAGALALLAIGSNRARKSIAEQRNGPFGVVVHPSAVVHPSVTLGPGTVVMAGAVVQPDTVIGRHCIINTSASVDHDCVIGDFCHVAPGAHLAGSVTMGEGVLAGIGSCAVPGMSVGDWAVVGAGAVVVHHIPGSAVVTGAPARPRDRRDG